MNGAKQCPCHGNVSQRSQVAVIMVCQEGGGGRTCKEVQRLDTALYENIPFTFFLLQVYPHMDVTNIMESASEVVIENWCNFHGKCHQKHHSHTVRPYRCLGRSRGNIMRLTGFIQIKVLQLM